MNKFLPLCLVALVITGCESMQGNSLEGTYKLLDDGQLRDEYVLQVGETMATYTITVLATAEVSSEYRVEDGYLYLTSPQTQVRFKITDTDTLTLENSFLIPSGKYVRVK